MSEPEILKKIDLQKIVDGGIAIYDRIKSQYEPENTGKFLAIEIESGRAYLADSSAEAVEIAKKEHPDKVFYVVRIGHSSAETLASLGGK